MQETPYSLLMQEQYQLAGIVDWRRNELEAIDRNTRKLLTMYKSLHPRADVDRLYCKRKNDGKGMISVDDW